MKISTVERKKTPQKVENLSTTTEIYHTLITRGKKTKRIHRNSWNPLKRKTSLPHFRYQQRKINISLKLPNHPILQRLKQYYQNPQTTFIQPPRRLTSRLQTRHNNLQTPCPYSQRSSPRTSCRKHSKKLTLWKDLFSPVVKVTSKSSSEANFGATSSDSFTVDNSYSPTPISAKAPVYNPTHINLQDSKIQQLKDGLLVKMIGPKGIRPYTVNNLYIYFWIEILLTSPMYWIV